MGGARRLRGGAFREEMVKKTKGKSTQAQVHASVVTRAAWLKKSDADRKTIERFTLMVMLAIELPEDVMSAADMSVTQTALVTSATGGRYFGSARSIHPPYDLGAHTSHHAFHTVIIPSWSP